MIEIFFQNQADAKKLHQCLSDHMLNGELRDASFTMEADHKYVIKISKYNEAALKLMQKAFTKFILRAKCDEWIRHILGERYYFTDIEEQQQIIDIIYSIFEGEREELAELMKPSLNKKELFSVIKQIIQPNISFSLDSFIKFRLRPFKNVLEKYVEIAIDEYKMEQEYQMFVEVLRGFLSKRSPKLQHLHLMVKEEVVFFDSHFYEIRKAELARMIDRKLISNHPIYVDSYTIAPLLSIAPEKIFLYCDDPEFPLVRTIKNIFEERVMILAIGEFYHLKSFLPLSEEDKLEETP